MDVTPDIDANADAHIDVEVDVSKTLKFPFLGVGEHICMNI